MNNFFSEYSAWFIFFCLFVGAAYSFALYHKAQNTWGTRLNRFLAALRFVVVSVICFLLLGWFFRQVSNQFEKPTVVFAVDNSQSLPLVSDTAALNQTKKALELLANELREKDFEVAIQTLDDNKTYTNPTEINFNKPATNLSEMLVRVSSTYENRNLAAVVLLSDGIYNQGSSPTFMTHPYSIFSVGLGDTLPQNDVSIKAAYHNKIAYLGNKFPILAEISHIGFSGRQIEVSLLEGNTVLESKKLDLKKDGDLHQLEFLTEAKDKGMRHYVVQVKALSGEFTTRNNTKHVYIDVLDNREKILLVAAAPHPDIKAIRAALEKNQNYEISLFIPNLSAADEWKPNEKYSMVIFHQIPAKDVVGGNILQHFQDKTTPLWFILGNESNLAVFNTLEAGLTLQAGGFQTDKVTPFYNTRFNRFTFADDKKTILSRYPPVAVPFGSYKLQGNAETMLFQRVGSVLTEKPLVITAESDTRKTAIIVGEGIWQWRLQEFARTENQEAFDEMIIKIAQYLATKDDKRRFRVYTTTEEYFVSESVVFETETYNKIYEPIYGQTVDLQLTDEKGKTTQYRYTHTAQGFRYQVNGLAQGVYRYKAQTILDGKTEIAQGEFTVKEMQLEALQTKADFGLLRQLAKQTDGEFFEAKNLQALKAALLAREAKPLIRSSEENLELIHWKWLFFALILLISIEWFFRKFKGGY